MKENVMLLDRMTYNLHKMERNPKYKKWLWGMRGAGLAVGGSIFVWATLLFSIAIFFSMRNEWPSNTVLTLLIVWFAFLLLGIVLGIILEYRSDHNKLKKGYNGLSDKTIKKLNVYFVILPYKLFIVALIGFGLFVLVNSIIK